MTGRLRKLQKRKKKKAMESFDKKVVSGIIAVAIFTASLYVFLAISSQDDNAKKISSETIQKCRDLTRESADVLVRTARQQNDEPENEQLLEELRMQAAQIKDGMTELDCYKTQDQWAYGSFKQEMSEYEAYIAEIVRQNNLQE